MANRIDLSNILINFLKKARYERHIKEGPLEENQFYAVTDGNEKTEYGDLFGNIENQADLYNALYASRLFKMEMCNDLRGYELVHKLYDRREFDLSKFTVVGNPVISKDGIVSGLNVDNYLTSVIQTISTENSSLEFNFKYKPLSKTTENSNLFKIGGLSLGIRADETLILFKSWGNGNYVTSSAFNQKPKLIIGETHDLKVGINSYHQLYIYAKLEQEKIYEGGTYSPQMTENVIADSISIGKSNIATGQFDLKQFSIKVDGEEVFNGLKDLTQYDTYTLPSSEVITIPYIPSVDGVKIVDVAYKPLVDQLYTETGMGNYIIIDETNKTFRLPLPDIYSQIEKKTSFTLRKWED